jgi:decaprenyl-phosphate phosphoribosyltransferase
MVADQGHPRKRHRAVAAGQLSPRVAVPAGVLLLGLGIAATQIDHPNAALATVVALYGANALAYIYVLKTVAVIEMASVAAGFFLRSIAGAAASHLFISTWFFVVVSFGALFLVVGKRLAERHHLGAGASTHRAVLAEYSDNYLNSSLTLIAAVVVTGYCLWAFDTSRTGLSAVDHNVLAIRLTVLPVVLTILHVLRLLERGGGGAPEDLIFDDRTVQVLGVIWAVLIGIGIYS